MQIMFQKCMFVISVTRVSRREYSCAWLPLSESVETAKIIIPNSNDEMNSSIRL